jgi:hypothetical protein
MEEKRQRAIRAIANHTRKRARVIVQKTPMNRIHIVIQIVGEDNKWHKHDEYSIDSINISANMRITILLLDKLIEMQHDGYLFPDGVIGAELLNTQNDLINEEWACMRMLETLANRVNRKE